MSCETDALVMSLFCESIWIKVCKVQNETVNARDSHNEKIESHQIFNTQMLLTIIHLDSKTQNEIITLSSVNIWTVLLTLIIH